MPTKARGQLTGTGQGQTGTPTSDSRRQAMPQITGNPLKFEYVPLDRLVPYPDNPRIHTDAQIDQIAASITEFGWAAPIVVDKDYGIVAGHGRALAAARLGLAEVPIVMNDAITEEQRAALVIAD